MHVAVPKLREFVNFSRPWQFTPLEAFCKFALHPQFIWRIALRSGSWPFLFLLQRLLRLHLVPPEGLERFRQLPHERPIHLGVVEALFVVSRLQAVGVDNAEDAQPPFVGFGLHPNPSVRDNQAVVVVKHHAIEVLALRVESHLDRAALVAAVRLVRVHEPLAEEAADALGLHLHGPDVQLHPRNLVQDGHIRAERIVQRDVNVEGLVGPRLLEVPKLILEPADLDVRYIGVKVQLQFVPDPAKV
mmetsp:Transcript_9451/g.24263  ORF Transcript_9451/g.24263 Transcript_9451/m.24263 type:complete len:245 (-) Transcript_9451:393-1127(-)